MTFALSSLSATIIFPILAPLFLGNADTIFKTEIPESIRAILFGMFLAAFPLAQFLFSPVVGEYSDREGRKRAFKITLVLECIGYLLSGAGIQYHHLSLLFLGRFFTGLGAANLSVCMATLVDFSSDEKSRVRYFGYGSAVAGVMFILGPFIGGRLSEYSFAFPMWIGGGLAILNVLMVFFFFEETLKKKDKTHHVDPMRAIHDVQTVFQTKALQRLYTVFFFFLFSWNILYQFLPALLVEEFNSSSTLIGDLSTFMGFIWLAGTLVISTLAHWTKHPKIVCFIALIAFAGMIAYIPYPNTIKFFILICAIAVFFAGGVWPILMGTISKLVAPGMQGRMLGLSQSVQSLAMLLAPFFGGFFLQAHSQVPFFIGASGALISALILIRIKKM